MPLLEWSDEQSVGVKELDDQHRKMFNLINTLFDLMHGPYTQESLDEVLQEMSDYGIHHLETEEKYFEEFNYPDKEDHKRTHDGYRKKITELMGKERTAALYFEILDLLENWWIEHITNMDKKYTSFFNEHGLR